MFMCRKGASRSSSLSSSSSGRFSTQSSTSGLSDISRYSGRPTRREPPPTRREPPAANASAHVAKRGAPGRDIFVSVHVHCGRGGGGGGGGGDGKPPPPPPPGPPSRVSSRAIPEESSRPVKMEEPDRRSYADVAAKTKAARPLRDPSRPPDDGPHRGSGLESLSRPPDDGPQRGSGLGSLLIKPSTLPHPLPSTRPVRDSAQKGTRKGDATSNLRGYTEADGARRRASGPQERSLMPRPDSASRFPTGRPAAMTTKPEPDSTTATARTGGGRAGGRAKIKLRSKGPSEVAVREKKGEIQVFVSTRGDGDLSMEMCLTS